MVYINHNVDTQIVELNGVKLLYYSVELPCTINGTIIDIETTGLKPQDGFITGYGKVEWNKLSCFVIIGGANKKHYNWDTDEYNQEMIERFEGFRAWCKDKSQRVARPLSAYNRRFETQWLDIKFDIELQPIAFQKKDAGYTNKRNQKWFPAAVQLDHLGDLSDNSTMLEADELQVMKHLVQDMYAQLALYVTKSDVVRRKKQFLPSDRIVME